MSDPQRAAPVSSPALPHDRGDPPDENQPPILFFDGVCGLCNSSVNWLLKADRKGVLRFAPLQGETAKDMLPISERESLDSVLLKDNAGLHRRSRAVVRVLEHLGGRYSLYAWLLWLVPLPLREIGYKIVAKSRYKIFGKKETCRLPTAAERGRLYP